MQLASDNASEVACFALQHIHVFFLHWPTEVSQGSGSSPKSLSKGSPKEFALEDTMTAEICGTEQAPGKTCQSQTTDPKHCFDSFCSWCIEDQVIRQWGIWGYLCCFHSSWRESLTSNKLHDAKSKGVLLLDLLVWRKRSTSFVSIFWIMMALEKALVRYLSYMLVWYCWWNISYTTYHQLIGKLSHYFRGFIHPRVVLTTIFNFIEATQASVVTMSDLISCMEIDQFSSRPSQSMDTSWHVYISQWLALQRAEWESRLKFSLFIFAIEQVQCSVGLLVCFAA